MLGFVYEPEEGSCRNCCSIVLVDVDRQRRSLDSTPAVRRATRACVTRPIHPKWRRSSPSCAAGDRPHGRRLRGLIVILWRAGLRIQEALALTEADLDHRRGALLVRRGKGGRRREVGMDAWGWEELQPWLERRLELPVGPLFCVITGPTRGRAWSSAAARPDMRRTAAAAGVRRRFAPHQLRHAQAVEMAREGVPLIAIQRQLGHSNLGVTSVYLQGIDNAEIIETVHARRAPMIPVSASLRL